MTLISQTAAPAPSRRFGVPSGALVRIRWTSSMVLAAFTTVMKEMSRPVTTRSQVFGLSIRPGSPITNTASNPTTTVG
jgi:hypothetical protein